MIDRQSIIITFNKYFSYLINLLIIAVGLGVVGAFVYFTYQFIIS